MALIETPEFWSALAFILVVLFATDPLERALKAWGKRKAEAVQSQFDEAKKLVEQAEKLKQQYETAYARRGLERQKLMREAETEIRFLETEILSQSADQIGRKTQEVEMRLKMIAEHGRQDVKRKMLTQVIQKAEKLLINGKYQAKENPENLTDQVCQALDTFETVLK